MERLDPNNVDITLLELLGSLIAIKLWINLFSHKCVTIYNDNPGASGSIVTRAPKLYRLDMQYLIRTLALLAVKNKFYFFGVWCIDAHSANMKIADGLSRFYNDDYCNPLKNDIILESSNLVINIANDLISGIAKQPPNLPKHVEIPKEYRQENGMIIEDIRHSKNKFMKQFNNTYNILFNN